MTDIELRIKVAELCGWTDIRSGPILASGCYGCQGYPPDREGWFGYSDCDVPNYPNDLNAMHEAEEKLSPEQRIAYMDYWGLHKQWDLCHATARQRAEAFVKAMEEQT